MDFRIQGSGFRIQTGVCCSRETSRMSSSDEFGRLKEKEAQEFEKARASKHNDKHNDSGRSAGVTAVCRENVGLTNQQNTEGVRSFEGESPNGEVDVEGKAEEGGGVD